MTTQQARTRTPYDITLTAGGVARDFMLAKDPNDGGLMFKSGLLQEIVDATRNDAFSYNHRDPRVDLVAGFEDFTLGAGFEDAAEEDGSDFAYRAPQAGFRGYNFSQGVDLSRGTRGYLSNELQVAGLPLDTAARKILLTSLGLFAISTRYINRWSGTSWVQVFDDGAGGSIYDIFEFTNSTATYVVAATRSAAYHYSTDGLTWTASEAATAAPAFRSTATASTSGATSLAVGEPAGATTNDIIILAIYTASDTVSIAPNVLSDWTLIATLGGVASIGSGRLYWGRRGGSAPDYTINFGSSVAARAVAAAYSGAKTTGSPIDAMGLVTNSGVSTTYTPTGSVQTLTVPTGVTSLTLTLNGAGGGRGAASAGGAGGQVTGTLTVSPGDTVRFYPGSAGMDDNGNGAGGAGGTNARGDSGGRGGNTDGVYNGAGGGGGAASVVTLNGTGDAQRVAVAAGGGGSGNAAAGNRGGVGGAGGAATGATGQTGTDTLDVASSNGGTGGTAVGAGVGGAAIGTGSVAGSNGSSTVGGQGGDLSAHAGAGGGGGGGYFGGGGGSTSAQIMGGAGGGGGSNYAGGLSGSGSTQGAGAASRTDGSIVVTYSAATLSPTVAAVTTLGTNRMVVGVLASKSATGGTAAPGGTTERADGNSTDGSVEMFEIAAAAAGTFGPYTATFTNSVNYSSVAFALLPNIATGANNVTRWAMRGQSSGAPVLWAIDNHGSIRNATLVTTPSNWSAADAIQVGIRDATQLGLDVIDNTFYVVHKGGITSYDGSTVSTVFVSPFADPPSNAARPVMALDNHLFHTFGNALLHFNADTNEVEKIWPRGPQEGNAELNGTITAMTVNEKYVWFALKNAAGNTYLMQIDHAHTATVGSETIYPAHTVAYLGANNVTAMAYLKASSTSFSSTNPTLAVTSGLAVGYYILPTPGLRPEDDSACRFDAVANRFVLGAFVNFRSLAFPKWLTRGDIEAKTTTTETVALQYQVPAGTATTLTTANTAQTGRTTAVLTTPVDFTRIRYRALLNTSGNTLSPVLRGLALHAAPNAPRDRGFVFTVKLLDGQETNAHGVKSRWKASELDTFLFGTVNQIVTLRDLFGNSYTTKVLDIQPQTTRYAPNGSVESLLTVTLGQLTS